LKNKDEFSSFHPIINFIYFAFVLFFSMSLMHPVFLLISLLASLFYAKSFKKVPKYMLVMVVSAAILNPVFNHEGITILFYLHSGNPVTLESLIYGFFSSCMLFCVMLWFLCFNEVISSDKFIYLFGKIMPSLSLILSMSLRFVPHFVKQFQIVSEAQYCIGIDLQEKKALKKLKNAFTIFSIMLTWSLENAIETADSMKSRGYGLKGRTAFSIYKFEKRDKKMLIWLIFCDICLLFAWKKKILFFRYYPSIKMSESPFLWLFLLLYALLCFTPLLINRKANKQWNSLQSKI